MCWYFCSQTMHHPMSLFDISSSSSSQVWSVVLHEGTKRHMSLIRTAGVREHALGRAGTHRCYFRGNQSCALSVRLSRWLVGCSFYGGSNGAFPHSSCTFSHHIFATCISAVLWVCDEILRRSCPKTYTRSFTFLTPWWKFGARVIKYWKCIHL